MFQYFTKCVLRKWTTSWGAMKDGIVLIKELAEKQLNLSRSWWKTSLVMTEQKVTVAKQAAWTGVSI